MRLESSLLALLVVSATNCFAADAPKRVVSFNQCGDQLVVALADPEQIAGLSPYAADRSLSVVADKARAFPRLDWQAESTIALGPDLVLIGQNDRPVTKHILRVQGLRLYEIALILKPRGSRSSRSRRCSVIRSEAKSSSPRSRRHARVFTPPPSRLSAPRCSSIAAVTQPAQTALRRHCSPKPA
jgi:hypothetical protein